MNEPLLIHSMGEFACITLPLLELAGARAICEIGAEHGGNSTVLSDWLRSRGGRLTGIDPGPSQTYLAWQRENSDHVTHVAGASLDVIPQLGAFDAWFIDGDHNWYSVFHELTAIRQVQRAADRPMLIFLHDVSWPCARRDMYYAPDRIPAHCRHTYSWDRGVTQGNPETIDGGFRGCDNFAIALQEGGPRNGVLTAIEDFVSGCTEELLWAHVPGVFGLGVLLDRDHPAAESIADVLAPLHEHPLLQRLEANRLANYLKVIEWQDGASRAPFASAA